MTPSSKLAAIGACALIAGAGGAGVAAVVVDGHGASDAATAAAPASGSTRAVSNTTSTAKQVYDGAKDAVVFISAQTPQGTATGSGFVVSSDGRIITNEHVVDGAQSVTVKLGTSGQEQQAQVLAADASKDLALLKIDADHLHALPLGDSSAVQVGDNVYAIGNPYGLDHTLTSGIVSALNREIQAPDGTPIEGALQTDAALNPGNSGGALLDGDGKVVGVNAQIASAGASGGGQSGNVGIGFAIPSATVKAFIAHPSSSAPADQAQPQEQQVPQEADPYGSEEPDQQPADPYGSEEPDQQQADPYGSDLPQLVLPGGVIG